MSAILIGKHFDLGGREIYEDRVVAEVLTTAGGLNLTVGVVADGVGGRDRGERASQLAVDGVIHALRQTTVQDVPTALTQAVQYAAQVVYNETSKYPGTSTTLAVAAILDNKQLFVANVGDSRVYLCRNKKVTQLTLDHTFANMMAIEGVMSWEAARENPRAHAVMRALGPQPKIPVDVGFYVNTTDPATADARGRKGIPLQTGDAVLVCSDGLIKDGPDGKPFIRPEEIWQVVSAQEEEKGARSLVSFALGRDANDNVSVVLLQTPDKSRKGTLGSSYNPKLIAGVVVGAILFVLLMGIGLTWNSNRQQTAAEQTRAAEVAITATFVAQSLAEGQQDVRATLDAGNATATAEFLSAASNVQQREAELAQTAAAQALDAELTLTREAIALICLRPENYAITFLDTPTVQLRPPAGTQYVTGNPAPRPLEASWRVQNNGVCAWDTPQLRPLDSNNRLIGQGAQLEVRQNGVVVDRVEPNTEATFVLVFNRSTDTQNVQEEWSLTVQSGGSVVSSLDWPRFALDTTSTNGGWLVLVAPTPTPTATFTPTPTPTPTPIPTETPEPPPPPPPPDVTPTFTPRP
jgi:PPM family protein phosphatase